MHAIGCCLSPLLREKKRFPYVFPANHLFKGLHNKRITVWLLLCVCGRDWMWSASLVFDLFFSSPDVEQSDMLLCTDGNTRPRETHTHSRIFIQLHEWLAVSFALFCSHTVAQVHYCLRFFSYLFTTRCPFISRLFSLHCIQRMWDDVWLYVCHFMLSAKTKHADRLNCRPRRLDSPYLSQF